MALYERRGFAAMTQPQQFCLAVILYLDEVNDGGHEQYFYNEDSDLYKAAVEGLRSMGATQHAAILTDASSVFAPSTPATTEQERRRQMEDLGDKQDGIFKTADERFNKLEADPGQRLETLLTFYALKHRSDFSVSFLSGKDQASQFQ